MLDYNGYQIDGKVDDVMSLEPITDKWKAFGWKTQIVNGHDESELTQAVSSVEFATDGSPHVIIAKTVKGKGVPMLEGHGPWHHKIPNEEEYNIIVKEEDDIRVR